MPNYSHEVEPGIWKWGGQYFIWLSGTREVDYMHPYDTIEEARKELSATTSSGVSE